MNRALAQRATKRRVFGVALLMLLTCCPCAFPLNPALDINQYAHAVWKNSDGVSKGPISSIVQTADGYLWLGSDFGLSRFDGFHSAALVPLRGQLPSNNIRKLLVSADGTVWIGTAKGLASWKNGSLTQYPSLNGQRITRLFEDHEGTLWVGTYSQSGGSLCAVRKGSLQCAGDDGRFGPTLLSLYEHAGYLWAGSSAGLWRWKPDAPKLYPLTGLSEIRDMTEAGDGSLLLATQNGLMQFIEGKTQANPLPAVGQADPNHMLRDRGGSLWIGTASQGLFHAHLGRVDVFTPADGLSGSHINCLFEDREGNMWAATDEGLERFRDLVVPTISTKQGLSSARVWSVLSTTDGSVWFGTGDGLNRWDHGQNTIYRARGNQRSGRPQQTAQEVIDPGLLDNFVESLFQDSRGRLWVSTSRGVVYREGGSFHPLSSVPARTVLSATEESNGDLWFADLNLGLFHLQDAGLTEQIPWTVFGGKGVAAAVAADPAHGGIWLGFQQGGLTYFKDGKVQASYTVDEGLGEGRVNRIRFDREGALWLATDGGLSRLKNGRIATLTSRNGLPCDAVQWSVEDDVRSLWVYTTCGLVHIATAEIQAWSADPKYAVKTAIFDNSDGFKSFATAGGFSPRVAQSADGKIWFEVVDGVSILDPLHLPFNKLPPPVHIEQITIDHESREADSGLKERLRLPALIRELQIDYTALSFVAPEKIRFRYKLEGHDSEWTEAGSRRQAFYNDLRPRNYTFRVMACNNNGVWNEAGASLEFSIAPMYYQTTAFWVACGAAFLGLLGVLYRLRLRQVAGKLSLLYNERLGERTRIARDLHDTLLQSLAGVSLQLHGVSKLAASAPEKTAPMIDNIRQQVDSAFREARLKVYNLRSPSLEGQGLAEALDEFVERMSPVATARISFTLTGEACACTPEVEEELLRIAQEATNNANRHAQAKEIRITLEYGENALRLTIADDGRGFDLEEGYRKTGHWGLKNMQERAAQLRGKCKITTAAGSGTQIEVRVPLPRVPRKLRARKANSSSDH